MHSFGHAAYFGLGAYGAALLVKMRGAADGAGAAAGAAGRAALGALLFGWFAVRLSGVYLAMLTLAFAQIVWSIVFQWEDVDRRLQRRGRRLADRRRSTSARLLLPADAGAAPSSACCCCGACCSRRSATRCAPAAIRRCAPRRSASTCKRVQWVAFAIAGAVCGVAGGAVRLLQGHRSRPRPSRVGRSIDGLVMVLLGGVQTLIGPVVGAAVFTWSAGHHHARRPSIWRALLGGVILLLVLVFPRRHRRRARQVCSTRKREPVRR